MKMRGFVPSLPSVPALAVKFTVAPLFRVSAAKVTSAPPKLPTALDPAVIVFAPCAAVSAPNASLLAALARPLKVIVPPLSVIGIRSPTRFTLSVHRPALLSMASTPV